MLVNLVAKHTQYMLNFKIARSSRIWSKMPKGRGNSTPQPSRLPLSWRMTSCLMYRYHKGCRKPSNLIQNYPGIWVQLGMLQKDRNNSNRKEQSSYSCFTEQQLRNNQTVCSLYHILAGKLCLQSNNILCSTNMCAFQLCEISSRLANTDISRVLYWLSFQIRLTMTDNPRWSWGGHQDVSELRLLRAVHPFSICWLRTNTCPRMIRQESSSRLVLNKQEQLGQRLARIL